MPWLCCGAPCPEPGTPVVLHGLVQRTDLNSARGVCTQWLSGSRISVFVYHLGKEVSVGAANATPIGPRRRTREGEVVAICGLKRQSAYNGAVAVAFGWLPDRRRLICGLLIGGMIDGPKMLCVLPANVAQVEHSESLELVGSTWQTCDVVRLVGLLSQPDLNGICGIVSSWIAGQQRWKVVLPSKSWRIVALKSENLQLLYRRRPLLHSQPQNSVLPEATLVEALPVAEVIESGAGMFDAANVPLAQAVDVE